MVLVPNFSFFCQFQYARLQVLLKDYFSYTFFDSLVLFSFGVNYPSSYYLCLHPPLKSFVDPTFIQQPCAIFFFFLLKRFQFNIFFSSLTHLFFFGINLPLTFTHYHLRLEIVFTPRVYFLENNQTRITGGVTLKTS